MSDIAIESQGTTIAIGDVGSPAGFTDIPEVRSIGGPDGQANWIDTVHNAIRAAYSARTQKQFRIVYTDGKIWEFEGYVVGFQASNEVDGVTRADVTIRITGAIRQVN
jgi:hypothetical protein